VEEESKVSETVFTGRTCILQRMLVGLFQGTYNGEVTTDGARGGGKRVGGTEDDTAGLDGVTALPDHGADGARGHVGNETGEERLAGEVGVVGLEVLLGGGDELDGSKLEAALLEALDDGADQAAL
jgi:hypothetical protein